MNNMCEFSCKCEFCIECMEGVEERKLVAREISTNIGKTEVGEKK